MPEARSTYRDISLDFDSQLTADFDGDHLPDVAIGQNSASGYTVRIQFTSRIPTACLKLPGAGLGIRIWSIDVDHDNGPDIVVTSVTSQLPIAVWISEGDGRFHAVNPWTCFPFQFGSPSHYAPQQSRECLAGISEDDRSFVSLPQAVPVYAYLESGNWITVQPPRLKTRDFPSELYVRGPPSTPVPQIALT